MPIYSLIWRRTPAGDGTAPSYVLRCMGTLAMLQKEEPAAERVRRTARAQAKNASLAISLINLGEVVYRVGKVKESRRPGRRWQSCSGCL